MKKIKLFSLVAAALFAGSVMAKSYIPTEVHEVVADEILYTAKDNATVSAGKTAGWIVIPSESYKDQTPLDLNGNKLSSSTSCLQVKTDGNVFNSGSRVIHLLVTGIKGIVASGNAASDRGFQIGATEYTEGMSEETEMNVVAGSGSTTNPVSYDGLDSKKTYIISVFASAKDNYLYAIKLIAASATEPGAPTLESIAIDGELKNTEYSEGETIDYTGLSVNGTFSDGSTGTVERGIVWSIAPELAVGTTEYTITATVGELTATKDVLLTVIGLESIAIGGELANTEYSEGEAVDYTGLSVIGTFSDGSTSTIEEGILWNIAPELAVGTTNYTITATVGELTATKQVKLTVTAVVLESLAFKGSLNLASCYVGEPLNLAGLTVEAVYSNGTKKDVTEEASITTDAIIESGTVTITASYGELIATTNAYIYVCKRPSTTGTVLLSYEHTDKAPTGIEVGSGLKIESSNIHTNKDKANGIKLDGGYVKDNAYVPGKVVSLSVEGGFKASDEIVVAAFFNNTDNTKQAQVDIFTLNADSTTTTLHTIGQAVNGRLVHNAPFEAVYTLTEDADTIRLGRFGGTATYIYTIKVIRPKSDVGSAFDQTQVETKAVKVIRDGQLLIIREGKTYTAQGVQVQ